MSSLRTVDPGPAHGAEHVPRTPLVDPTGCHHSGAAIDCRSPVGRDPGSEPAPGRLIGGLLGLRGFGEPVD